MIINQGLGSQLEPITIFYIDISQIFNWFVMLGFCVIARNTFKHSVWVLIIIFSLITTKIFQVLIGDLTFLYIGYKVSLLSLTFLIGFIFSFKRSHFSGLV